VALDEDITLVAAGVEIVLELANLAARFSCVMVLVSLFGDLVSSTTVLGQV